MFELDDVAKTYPGGARALHPVSLRIARGELTVLLGRSGAGKSTLLRCLNGLVVPDQGCVRVDGAGPLAGRALREHRRRTAMIFQHHRLLGRHSALQNVLIGRMSGHPTLRSLLPLPAADQRVALACLDRVGLLEKALTRADRLSGGEQQRVGIARGLAQEPTTILADEPVASVDPETAGHVLGLLREICRERGFTAVVSLHQVDLALAFGDRIVGLREGRVVCDLPAAHFDADAHHALYRGDPRIARLGVPPAPPVLPVP